MEVICNKSLFTLIFSRLADSFKESWITLASKIINYRGNRFNNLFTGAVTIVHRHDDIIDFLTNFIDSRNLKLESVLADIQCSNVMSQDRLKDWSEDEEFNIFA
jgi:hypothetical protein